MVTAPIETVANVPKVVYAPSIFVFCVLKVQVDNDDFDEIMRGQKYRNMVFTTSIQEFTTINEDEKFRLLDQAQSAFLRSPTGMVYKGKVNSRKLLKFSSYAEASQAKEKYTISD